MIMKFRRLNLFAFAAIWAVVWLAAMSGAHAVTVTELQQRLKAGDQMTLIDVRSTRQFEEGHIPGAINIPASLCAQKHLPPLGKVIVYDAGLGLTQPDEAAAALGAKKGISVEILDGGYAAWQSLQTVTTRGRGMKAEKYNYISYADLKAAKPDEIVLVDLREQRSSFSPNASKVAGASTNQPLTDLSREFPGLHQSKLPIESKAVKSSGGKGPPPLLVLIDNGDGKAQRMVKTLKSQGVKRYVILAGGELILARHGQAGLERNSPGHPFLKSFSSATNTPTTK